MAHSRQHKKKQHSAACSVRDSKCQRSGRACELPCLSPITEAQTRSPNNSKCHGKMTPQGPRAPCPRFPQGTGTSDNWNLHPGALTTLVLGPRALA